MNKTILRIYFTISVILLVMLAFAIPFVDFQSATGVVTKLNLMILVPSAVGSGLLLYREVRQERDVQRPEDWESEETGGHDAPWER
jgi:uncharacterized membrane protein